MAEIVDFNHMRIGQKGGGKHWTKKEVEDRQAAAQKFERKKKRKLKVPDWLSDDARKVWRKTIKDMDEFEVLDKVDEDVLGTYCDAVAKLQAANQLIDMLNIENEQDIDLKALGSYTKIAQGYARLILAYSSKLGLNAEARARLAKKTADGDKDPNAELFE